MNFVSVYPMEKNLKPFLWKAIIGPAGMVDSIVETVTLGNVSPLLKLKVTMCLAKSRMDENEKSDKTNKNNL